jgi:hypothetical protein
LETRFAKYLRYIVEECNRRLFRHGANGKNESLALNIWCIHDLAKGAIREEVDIANKLLKKMHMDHLYIMNDDGFLEESGYHEAWETVGAFSPSLSLDQSNTPTIRDVALCMDIYMKTGILLESPDRLEQTSWLLAIRDAASCLSAHTGIKKISDTDKRKRNAAKGGKGHCLNDDLFPFIISILASRTSMTAKECWAAIEKRYPPNNPFNGGKYSFHIFNDRLVYTWETPSNDKENEQSMGLKTFSNWVSKAKKIHAN